MFDFLGQDRVIRDYLGNVRTVHRLGDPGRAALTDSLTPFGIQPVGMSGFGDPVFSDEFGGVSLNTSKWEPFYPDTEYWNVTEPGGHLTNTDEPQGYDLSGITFDEDGMVLTLREEETVLGLAYTSGMVSSYPSFNQMYGYFEARMFLTNTQDAWPAFWMMPTRQTAHPEIDVVENDAKPDFNNITYHTFHQSDMPGSPSSTNYGISPDVGSDWHTFGVHWEPELLRWYVDGELAKTLAIEEEWANTEMYLICNLAGKKNSTPVVPASIHVDYIRAWTLPG